MAAKNKSPKKPVAGDEVTISDERYRKLFESSSDAIMLLDSGRFFDCNPATLEMFGLTKELFIKLHPSEISPPRQANGRDSRAEADRMIDEAFKKGSNKFEWIHRRSNGEDFPVTVWLTAFHLEGRHILQATVREITSVAESVRDLEVHRLELQKVLGERSANARKESEVRKRIESDLRRLLKAVETSFNAVALLDMDMNFVYANREFCRMVGIESGTMTGRNAKEFVPKKSMKIIMDGIEANMAGMEPERFEVKAINTKGREFWVEIAGSVLFDDRGEPEGLLAIVNDITERREILNALKESEEKFKMLVERSLDGILVIQDGKVAYMNPALVKLSGHTLEEQIGREFIENVAPEARKEVMSRYRARMKGKEVPAIYETILLAKDGTRILLEVNAGVMEYGGRPADFVYLRDLTARRRAEDALKSTEHMLRTVLDNIPARVFWKDRDLKYLGCNMQFARDSGLESPGDLIGKDDFQMGWKEQADMYRADDRAVIESGEPKIGYEEPQTTPDGDMIWVRTSKVPLKNTADDIIGVLGTYEDITEFKKASEEIRTLKEQFEYVLGATKTGFDLIDEDCNLLYVDPQWAEKLGDYTGKKCHDYFMGRKKPCKGCAIPKALKSGKPVVSEEYLKKENRHIEVHTIPFKNEGGKQLVAEFNIDITERKKMLQNLQESEEKFRNLAEYSPNMIFINKAGRVVYANKICEDAMGYTREEFYSNDFDMLDIIHEDCRDLILDNLRRHFAGEEIRPYEYMLVTKGGKILDVIINTKIIEYGGDTAILGIVTDITERKKAEEEIRNYSEQLKSLSDNLAHGMVYQLNAGSGGDRNDVRLTYISPAVERMHGLKVQRITKNPLLLYSQIVEEDRNRLMEAEHKAFATMGKVEEEVRVILPSGDACWRQFISAPRKLPNGDIIWDGIELDITERKNFQLMLQESEQKYRRIFEEGPVGMVTMDDKLRFATSNAAFCQMIGYSEAELQKMTFRDITHPEHLTQDTDAAKDLIAGKMPRYKTEKRYMRKDGSIIWASITVTIIKDSEGSFQHFLTLIENITRRKETQDALKRTTNQLQGINENLADGMVYQIDGGKDGKKPVFTYLSPAVERMRGIKWEDAMRNPRLLYDQVIEEDRELMHKTRAETFAKREKMDMQLRIRLPSGQVKWHRFLAVPSEDADGNVIWNGIELDITEDKIQEDALRASEQINRSIVDSSPWGMYIYELKDDDRLVFSGYNAAADRIVGLDNNQFMGKTIEEAFPQLKKTEAPKRYREVARTGETWNSDQLDYDEQDIRGAFEVTAFRISPKRIIVAFQDISDRKLAERALRDSETKHRLLMEKANDAIFLADADTGFLIDVNDKACQLTGRSRKELIGMHQSKLHPPKEAKKYQQIFKEHVKKGTVIQEEIVVQRKDGSTVPISISASVFELQGKKVNQGIFHDLTERLEAERALESSREQLNALFQASTSGIGVESGGKLFFVNPAFLEMFGYSDEEELAGKPLASIVAPKDRKRVKGYSKLRLKRKAPSSYEFAGIRKDGTTFDAEVSVSTYQIDKKAYYVGFVQDITERKNAERVMKESEARFRRMAENIHDGLTIIEDGKVTYVNERACEIYGYPPEELMKKAPLDMAVPEDRVQLQAIMKNARKTGKRLGELEFWVQAKDGSRRYVRTRISSSKAGGSTSEFIITTDITARKQAEDENKRRMMKFLLEDGRIYLVKEFLPGMSIEAFNDLLNLEYFGLVISRTPKKDIAKSIKGPFDYMWLGEKEDGRELFENILSTMNRFGGKSVVLIDRLDYLVFKYGFKETLDFIFRLRDMAYLKEMVVIISIDPSTMDEGELNIMRKEMGEVEQRQVPRPPEEIFEIAQLIYEKNSAGIKPSFSDIGEELKISKPTFRKRVRRLINAGYAIVLTKGNRKVLELTQKGRNLFFK